MPLRPLLDPALPLGPSAGADEWHLADGACREAWLTLDPWLRQATPTELLQLHRDLQRQLRDHGVTYAIHGAPEGESRSWKLDPIPWLVSSADWQTVENGLIQRAELLDAILTDLYGPQELLRHGILPPELIFSHPGFLHPCRRLFLPARRQLTLYAADLARGPDGRFWIINDRTQAPSGFGYVVENRVLMTRTLPSPFEDAQVRRLSPFFRQLRESLESFPSSHQSPPRVVILTPGPQNETYFEHAFLASYLGYSLVQGDDLAVRDGKVWLRSLGGLEPVDVIIRRVDSDFSDPLELRGDSRLGVPGLLQAIRNGSVTVVNHPGAGILEHPGLLPFLPAIARFFRQEDLILPSAATRWCGRPEDLEWVLPRLDRLIVKSIHRSPTFGATFGPSLTAAQRSDLERQIRRSPHLFVGQEILPFSTTPCCLNGRLDPRISLLRGFAAARSDGSYHVMPGALARVAGRRDSTAVSSQLGSTSKDVWILGSDPEPFVSLWEEPAAQLDARHLPSRSGENLFWTGRYAERAEGVARLLRRALAVRNGETGEDHLSNLRHRELLLQSILGLTEAAPISDSPSPTRRETCEIHSLLYDRTRPGTLPHNLHSFRDAAYAVRDLWSPDSWRVIESIVDTWVDSPARPNSSEISSLHDLIVRLTALLGLNLESMTRDAGWRLLDSGRRVERTLFLLSLIRQNLVPTLLPHEERLILESTLAASDSLVTYRKRFRSAPRLPQVLSLMLLERHNPRSVFYQIERLHLHLHELPQSSSHPQAAEFVILGQIRDHLDRLSPGDLLQTCSGHRPLLLQSLEHLTRLVQNWSDAITETYFRHLSQSWHS